MCTESRPVLGMSSLMEIRNAKIFSSYSQSLLRSLASRVMRTSVSLELGGGAALAFTFGVNLTVCLACICLGLAVGGIISFGLTVDGIDFWHLTSDSADL